MFGSSFGTRNTSTFGQTSSFGKPATSFSSPGFGSTSTSLFGQPSQPTTSLFGSTAPTFGQTTTTQSFGNFGSGTGAPLFGTQQTPTGTTSSLFGNQNTSANAAGGSLFGAPAPSTFGSNSGFGSFGSSSNPGALFGQTQPNSTQSTSLFGPTNSAGTSLFGTSTSAFSSGAAAANGTTIKFNPVTGSDTVMKNGIAQSISTKHHCITCMKEYESKSLEELRYEDYLANRKGPVQGAQSGPPLFGNPVSAPLFGNNTSTASTSGNTLFGNSGFGQSSVFGTNNPQSNNSLFGKSSSTAPFGTTTTTQPASFGSFSQPALFGTNTNQTKPAFGAPQAGTSVLFNSNTAGNTNFGTQSPGFGFGTQSQNQVVNLFGQPQNKFVGFGTQTTSNFTFGSNTGATNTTSLFTPKPATTVFGIASTTTGNTFGTTHFGSNTSAGSNVFGGSFNKLPQSGFSFGPNTTASSALGGNNSNGSSLLFGNNAAKSTNFFAGTNSSSGLTNTGFGSSGGFGSTNNTNYGGLNFGNSSFGNTLNTSPQNIPGSSICDQIQVLSVIPYGNSPLYKHLRTSSGKNDNLLKPSVVPQKPSTENSSYKVSTQINNIVVRKAHTYLEPSKKSLFDKVDEGANEKTLNQQRSSPRYLKLKPRTVSNKTKIIERDIADDNLPAAAATEPDVNKENIDLHATYCNADRSLPEETNHFSNLEINENDSSSFEDDTMLELGSKSSRLRNKNHVTYSKGKAVGQDYNNLCDTDVLENTDNTKENEDEKSFKRRLCGVKLVRPDYFTVPSLNNLDEMVDEEGRCIVKNFTVGRHKYGNVTFYEAFDVAGLDLDSIVFFRHKEVEIYPNEEVKPPVGTGLNRRAQVTLDRVWPIDKTTREVINSPERLKQLNFVGKLKRSSVKMNAQFIEYRPLTGSWVFEVEHFSKYGLDESDDEETSTGMKEKLKKDATTIVSNKSVDLKKIIPPKEVVSRKKRGLDGKVIFSEAETTIDSYHLVDNDEAMMMDEECVTAPFISANSESAYEEFRSPIEKLARNLDNSLHKVQLMKASFYINGDTADHNSDLEISMSKGIPDLDLYATGRIDAYRSPSMSAKTLVPLVKLQFTSQFPPPVDVPIADFSIEEYKPPFFSPETKLTPVVPQITSRPLRVSPKYRNSSFPFVKSIVKSVKMSLCDTALYFGQHFRIGWSHGLTTVCLSSAFNSHAMTENELDKLCRLFTGRKEKDFSSNLLNVVQMKTYTNEYQLENIGSHLKVCLKETIFNYEEGLPLLTPKVGPDALHEHCDIEQRTVRIDEDYNRQVWELMVALWGNIPDVNIDMYQNSHKNKILRKAALSKWLKNIVSSTVEKEANENYITDILSLLSCGKIYEACKRAILNNDHNLALILSQIGGNEITRSLMGQQLKQWHESEADQLIDTGRLKIMTLVAGHLLYISSKSIINTCENMDWKRAFAHHLWYITRPSDSLVEALLQYENAYKSEDRFASPPHPMYKKNNFEFETSDGRKAEDLCYHLLRLYSRRSYPLEIVLNPVTYTADVLDYRLSWFVLVTLKSLGYNHMSEESEYIVHTSFATQLEILDLWHWSVFVLLHITELGCRSRCVKNIINKNVQLLSDNIIGLNEKEKFVCEKLEVPAEWIYHSKAMLAESLGRYKEAAWYYIKAKRWNEAHEIVINHIVANAVINESYDVLQELINEIIASERVISGWNYRGAIISDYLTVISQVNSVVRKQSLNPICFLESIQSLMSSICTKIKYFPTTTTKERLCQAEISKRVIQVIRTVLNLQRAKQGIPIRFIVNLIDQLPLPEDYKQQELQEIISWWMNK